MDEKIEAGSYVKHRQGDGIGRVIRIEGDKIVVRWDNTSTIKYLLATSSQHFVVVPRAAKSSRLADPTMHLAAKLNYNDAEYRGICSWPVIEKNRANAQSWCSQSECWRLQKKGNLRPRLNEPDKGWVCDEAHVFSDFYFTTGGTWLAEQKGSAGKDLVMATEKQVAIKNRGRLAFLTTRAIDAEEKQRYVFGIYEIGNVENVGGDDNKWTTCIEAVEEKSFMFDRQVRVLFWSVYQNSKPGEKWGQGRVRYLAERQALMILDGALSMYKGLPSNAGRRRHMDILSAHLERLRR